MTARLLRLLAVLPVVAALTVTLHVARVGPTVTGCAFAAGTHHAALVVEHANGSVIAICISFTDDQITGEEMLQQAHQNNGLEYATADYGSYGKAVCQIDNEPQQYPPGCWTASSPYWAMFVSRGGAGWQTSSRGISSQTFGDGDAEGFRYEGQSDNSTPPSPAGVCPPPASPTPPATPPATASSPRASSASRPAPSPPAGASPAAAISVTAAATATTSVPGATTPAETTTTSSPSPAAHPVITGVTAAPSPPATPVSAGAWTAIALGSALVVLLAARLSMSRRRRRPPAEQP